MATRSKRREPRSQAAAHSALSRWPLALALLGIAALGIRVMYLVELRGTPFFSILIGDSLQYDNWAQRISGGEWLGTDVFYQSPLYPYLLGAFYAVAGHEVFGVRVAQAMLGASSVVLVAVAGRQFFDERTGLLAGALLAIYPPAIFFDGLIQKASLDLFLMCGLLAALGCVRSSPRRRWFVLAGVTLGALALNRENARLLYPVVALWLYRTDFAGSTDLTATEDAAGMEAPNGAKPPRVGSRVRPLMRIAFFTFGVVLVLVPVGARNTYIGGEFLVSTSQSGPNFYIGNRLGANGGYEPLIEGRGNAHFEREDAARLAREASGRPLSAGEVSSYWWGRALDDIRMAPGAWLRLMARKAWMTMAATEPPDTESIGAYSDESSILQALQPFTFGVLLALAGLGTWTTRARWRSLWVLHASFGAMALSVVVFYVFARYRYPLVPVAALFAAAGLAALPDLRRVPATSWAAPAIVFGAGLILLHIPARMPSDATYINYGGELLRLGRPAEAIPLLERAVAAEPDEAEPRLTLALALRQTLQTSRATEELRAAVKVDPQSVQAHEGLASALHQAGQLREAITHYLEALRLRPDSIEAMSNVALALAQAGDAPAAIAQFERAIAVAPSSLPLRMNYCSLLQEAGRAADAVRCLQKAAAAAAGAGEIVTTEYALAQALLNVGQTEAAIFSLDRALAAARTASDVRALSTIQEALRIVRANR